MAVTLNHYLPEDAGDVVFRWQMNAQEDIRAAVRAGAPTAEFRSERSTVQDLGLALHWNYHVFVYQRDTIISASLGKTDDPAWGRAVNVMVVHTRLRSRGRGRAAEAYRAVMEWARGRGYGRIITVSGSLGGWRTHHRLGLTAWGCNGKGQIVFEHPLTGEVPPGPSPRARRLQSTRPMTLAEQAEVLTDPAGPYRVHPLELPREVRPR